MRLGELFQSYERSPAFGDLKPTSQAYYEKAYINIEWLLGNVDIADIRRTHVIQMRDVMADTPGVANRSVSILSVMLTHAMDLDLIPHNPGTESR